MPLIKGRFIKLSLAALSGAGGAFLRFYFQRFSSTM
jgi:hypothetical protein